MPRKGNRIVLVALTCTVLLVSLALVGATPLALQVIGSSARINWTRLSNIGQTYGAVSALLAAVALVGVAISILAQVREARHNRWEAGRARHFELMRIAVEDPFYRQVYSMPGTTSDMARLVGYINMLFEYWIMLWEFGDISEEVLRLNLNDVLITDSGALYWRENGPRRLEHPVTRRENKFNQIANDVYRKVTADPEKGNDTAHRTAPAITNAYRRTLKLCALIAIPAACWALIARRTGREKTVQ